MESKIDHKSITNPIEKKCEEGGDTNRQRIIKECRARPVVSLGLLWKSGRERGKPYVKEVKTN